MDIKEALEIAEHRCIASGDATEQACMALAAEYRRLTELRPMSEAPAAHDPLIGYTYKGDTELMSWTGSGYINEEGQALKAEKYMGYLTLPSPWGKAPKVTE